MTKIDSALDFHKKLIDPLLPRSLRTGAPTYPTPSIGDYQLGISRLKVMILGMYFGASAASIALRELKKRKEKKK